MKASHSYVLAFGVILSLGLLFQKDYIQDFPSYKHAWAQADRFALAKGFLNNGLNFFKPETYVHCHQYIDGWQEPSEDVTTAVEFPIHDYISALLMRTLGTSAPWVFRAYILLYSFLGLFFLFKLSQLLSSDIYRSLTLVLFAATSPLFVYYQGGFLPSIPSLANTFIGIYFYALFRKEGDSGHFSWSILFFTLATLSRTPFAIPFIAILSWELLKALRKKTWPRHMIIPTCLAALALIISHMFNAHVREEHGSIFLGSILPAMSIEEANSILSQTIDKWGLYYFSTPQYLALILVVAVTILLFIKGRLKISRLHKDLLAISAIIIMGCIAFSLLMLKQFPAHDYYFLDTFFFPVVLLFGLFSSLGLSFEKSKWTKLSRLALLCFSIAAIFHANYAQESSRITGPWDFTNASIKNYTGSADYLDSIGVSRTDKILVIAPCSPNIPFLFMERTGYALMSNSEEHIKKALNWDYDYFVFQNDYFLSDLYLAYPDLIKSFRKEGDNGRISVYSKDETLKDYSLKTFLGLDKQELLFSAKIDFEDDAQGNWQNAKSLSEYAHSGSRAGLVTREMEYGLGYRSNDLPILREGARKLIIESYFRQESKTNVKLVASLYDKGVNSYYKVFDLGYLLESTANWEKVELFCQLPQVNSEDYELVIYLMNSERQEISVDDFEIHLY